MELIVSALLRHRYDAAGGVAVFGGQGAGDDLYFLDGVFDGLDIGAGAGLRIIAEDAVLEDGGSGGTVSRYIEDAEGTAVGVAVHSDAGIEVEGVQDVALVERHFIQEVAL